ncbi:FG-GAP-like repeat-containing protein [Tunicatimonas sp.]|uniref:FG-GAP-like repeat-containing protein n=1 Tax=Tunicatimonas sp. TaxID=1940096 RepID=UPI003C786373
MQYLWLIALIMLPLSTTFGQLLQDYSNIASIRHSAVDSLRIGGGVVVFDYNNDGLEDIYLAGGEVSHQLYQNLGNFDFRRVTEVSGLSQVSTTSYGANAADLNNDGWVDLFIGTGEGQTSQLLKNNGDGTFSNISESSGIATNRYWSTAVTFADFNADGLLDIYVGNYARNPTVPLLGSSVKGAYPNELYLSTGDFAYEEVASSVGVAGSGFTLAVRATDPDQDHDMDLHVVNDFGTGGNEGNKYYENDGQGNFTERSQELELDLRLFGMGAGLGDYDGDGDLDWYISDIGQNHLLQQQADGTYVDKTSETLAIGDYVSWGAEFWDANHDAKLDLFMANGAVLAETDQPLLYYENLGENYLSTQLALVNTPFFARGFAYADLDLDGDLDIVVNPVAETDTTLNLTIPVIRNTADLRFGDRGYLQVQVASEQFTADAYGSILKLHLSDGSQLLRVVDNGGSFASKHSSLIHFGLNTHQIDSLEVVWPDGNRHAFNGLFRNSVVKIHDTEGLSFLRKPTITAINPELLGSTKVYPVPAQDYITVEPALGSRITEARLYDLAGHLQRIYCCLTNHASTFQLSLKNIPTGTYILEVVYTNRRTVKRVIVQN